MTLEEEKKVSQDEGVRGLLREDHKAELGKILSIGEKYKKEGEEMKKEFWRKCWLTRLGRDKYNNLILQYEDSKKEYMKKLSRKDREILDRLNEVGKDKFIEGYMHDKILYNGDVDKEMEKKSYGYTNWKAGNVVMEKGVLLHLQRNGMRFGAAGAEAISKMKLKEGVHLYLTENNIGDAGAEAISKMELKEGIRLDLDENNIGAAGAEAISKMELRKGVLLNLGKNDIGSAGAKAISKMKLKEGVYLSLNRNNIGDAGAEAISKMELKDGVNLILGNNNIGSKGAEAISKMELKEGVLLDLYNNKIGDAGAEAISKMELKEGVALNLGHNNISEEMKNKLRAWAQGYKNRGINCGVYL